MQYCFLHVTDKFYVKLSPTKKANSYSFEFISIKKRIPTAGLLSLHITQPLKPPVTASCKNPIIEIETLAFLSLSGGTGHAQ